MLCPDCQKFRCICERPAPASAPAPSSLFRRAFVRSTSSSGNSNNNVGDTSSASPATSCSSSSWTLSDGSAAVRRRSSLTSLQYSTNMFKRFAERMLSIQDSGQQSPVETQSQSVPQSEPQSVLPAQSLPEMQHPQIS